MHMHENHMIPIVLTSCLCRSEEFHIMEDREYFRTIRDQAEINSGITGSLVMAHLVLHLENRMVSGELHLFHGESCLMLQFCW